MAPIYGTWMVFWAVQLDNIIVLINFAITCHPSGRWILPNCYLKYTNPANPVRNFCMQKLMAPPWVESNCATQLKRASLKSVICYINVMLHAGAVLMTLAYMYINKSWFCYIHGYLSHFFHVSEMCTSSARFVAQYLIPVRCWLLVFWIS